MIHVYVCMYYNNPSHMKVNGEHYFKISQKLKQFGDQQQIVSAVFAGIHCTVHFDYCWAKLGFPQHLHWFTKNEWPARNGKQRQSIVYIESNPLVEVLALLVSEAYTECISY